MPSKKNAIHDMWEEWGRHIWEKRVLGIFTQKQILISDIWEEWGRRIWEKRVLGIFTQNKS